MVLESRLFPLSLSSSLQISETLRKATEGVATRGSKLPDKHQRNKPSLPGRKQQQRQFLFFLNIAAVLLRKRERVSETFQKHQWPKHQGIHGVTSVLSWRTCFSYFTCLLFYHFVGATNEAGPTRNKPKAIRALKRKQDDKAVQI